MENLTSLIEYMDNRIKILRGRLDKTVSIVDKNVLEARLREVEAIMTRAAILDALHNTNDK
jgi:hypothetical protein